MAFQLAEIGQQKLIETAGEIERVILAAQALIGASANRPTRGPRSEAAGSRHVARPVRPAMGLLHGSRPCCEIATYLPNNSIASSAKTPPVIAIGTNGAFAAISALEIMI
jgi:hypothetical protein